MNYNFYWFLYIVWYFLFFKDSIEGISQTYLIPYFKDVYRPVHKSDIFVCRAGFKNVEFKVVETKKCCIVGTQTIIFDEGEQKRRWRKSW